MTDPDPLHDTSDAGRPTRRHRTGSGDRARVAETVAENEATTPWPDGTESRYSAGASPSARSAAASAARGRKGSSLAGRAPGDQSIWDELINDGPTITVVVPTDPPDLRGGAARALLRLLCNVFHQRAATGDQRR